MTPAQKQKYQDGLAAWREKYLTPEDDKQRRFIKYYDALKAVGRAALDKEAMETFKPKVDWLKRTVQKL